jgi:hypothetical protein
MTNVLMLLDRMRSVAQLEIELGEPLLTSMVRRFLHGQLYGADYNNNIPLEDCPINHGNIALHHSARSVFYAPNELSGMAGMHQQMIRSNPSFRGRRRFDTVLIKISDAKGFLGMSVARVMALLVVKHEHVSYECCLVRWYRRVSYERDPVTGLWIVEPELNAQGHHSTDVIHVECILRPCHLIGVCGDERLPRDFSDSSRVLDLFCTFYVNHYIDYHSHQYTR